MAMAAYRHRRSQAPRAGRRPKPRWEHTVLGALAWVAYPAMAGLACTFLSLAVVTWVPALTATAVTLRRWRQDGDEAVFRGVFADFGRSWGMLWRQGVVVGIVSVVLVVNMIWLFSTSSSFALTMVAIQVGLGLVVLTYHLCLAAVVALHPKEGLTQWRWLALQYAFAGWRGPVVLLSAIAITILTLPLGIGPALFGPSVPLIIALALIGRTHPQPKDS